MKHSKMSGVVGQAKNNKLLQVNWFGILFIWNQNIIIWKLTGVKVSSYNSLKSTYDTANA